MNKLQWNNTDNGAFVQGQNNALSSSKEYINYGKDLLDLTQSSTTVSPQDYYKGNYAEQFFQSQRGLWDTIKQLEQDKIDISNEHYESMNSFIDRQEKLFNSYSSNVSAGDARQSTSLSDVRDYRNGNKLSINSNVTKWSPLVQKVSQETGVPPEVLLAKIHIESTGIATAQSSRYGGLTQIDKTQHSRWNDPEYNLREGARLYNQNKAIWEKRYGKGTYSFGIGYMNHQQGSNGARHLWDALNSNPNMSASEALYDAWKGNRQLKGLSREQGINWIERNVIKSNSGKMYYKGMTVKDFAGGMINTANGYAQLYTNEYQNFLNNSKVNFKR